MKNDIYLSDYYHVQELAEILLEEGFQVCITPKTSEHGKYGIAYTHMDSGVKFEMTDADEDEEDDCGFIFEDD